MSLVPPQRVHLQLHKVHLGRGHRQLGIGLILITVLAVLAASPLRTHALDPVLVVVTDVLMPGRVISGQLQSPLGYCLLDPGVVTRVTRALFASQSVLNQAALVLRTVSVDHPAALCAINGSLIVLLALLLSNFVDCSGFGTQKMAFVVYSWLISCCTVNQRRRPISSICAVYCASEKTLNSLCATEIAGVESKQSSLS